MNLNYKTWNRYRECPQKYYLKDRKDTSPDRPQDDYNRLYGLLMDQFFHTFSTIWKYKAPYMPDEIIKEKMQILFDKILETSFINWNSVHAKLSREEILEEALQDASKIMNSQNQNYFLNTSAGIDIELITKNGVKIKDSIDFIYKHPMNNTVLIFDGKSSKKLGKANKNKLLFYALLYHFHYKAIPDSMGFLYYRYNTMVPVEINVDILNNFRAVLSHDIKVMLKESDFKATPCTKSCKWCDYSHMCLARLEKASKRRKPSQITADSDGQVINFGF